MTLREAKKAGDADAGADGEAHGAAFRTVRVLQAIAASDRGLSLKALADGLELPPSSVHRLLQLLVKAEMVERGDGQTYRPGRLFLRTSAQVLHNFIPTDVARPFVRELWSEWQETTSFCLYRPAARLAIVAETLPSPHRLQFVMETFDSIPLLWGSLGRAILSQLPDTVIDAILAESGPGPLSGRPAPDRDELWAAVAGIREQGYALYDDREVLNVAGVAAPVVGPSGGLVGSLGVVMPSARFARLDKAALASSVLIRARKLGLALGPDAG